MSHAERQAKADHTQIANRTTDQNVTGVTAPGTVKRTHGVVAEQSIRQLLARS